MMTTATDTPAGTGANAEQSRATTVPMGQTAYVAPGSDRAAVSEAGGDRYPIITGDRDSYEGAADTGGTLWEGAIAVSYREGQRWDGSNRVSLATGSQWVHERLAQTRRGRYYITTDSHWQGSRPSARAVSVEEAGRWLARCGYEPDDPDVAEYSPRLAAALRAALMEA